MPGKESKKYNAGNSPKSLAKPTCLALEEGDVAKVKSYTSGKTSALSFLREASNLYRHYRQASDQARVAIQDIRSREAVINENLHLKLRGLDILEIGPGQFQAQMKYLAVNNRVVGIDLDVITQNVAPFDYLKMLRTNGLKRTAKTLGRKILGVDRQFSAELLRQIGVGSVPTPKVIQMDACKMSFPNESFDFVYARSVFHHLPDPSAALDGIVRVLRPGGAAYILLHLYTSATGCLDPRIYTDRRNEVQGWPHLRPRLNGTLNSENTYLNKLRLQDWQKLFDSKMPFAKYFANEASSGTFELARTLRSQGELLDYSLEELTTNDFAVLWRKPLCPRRFTETHEMNAERPVSNTYEHS
jgi:SAM-dependent methyltransferase